ncbi:hypothetical protein [Parafrigoribacterium soli]|uniref:hypothetical protein n=1 Tax=Parafrigoribacterium soli TaxID=3144663 RepID=UPI0032F03711
MSAPADIRGLLVDAVAELEAARAKTELLAELTERRRLFGLVRPLVLKPIGRVWRLGVLLLARDGSVFATGEITRAMQTGRPTFQSPGAEQRRSYRALALRSGLPEGETVNFNATAITLETEALRDSTAPLYVRGDEPFVRWSHSLGGEMSMPLDAYLRHRVELLTHPPEGA